MFTCLIHIGDTSTKSVSVVDLGQKVEYEHINGLVQCSASSEMTFQKNFDNEMLKALFVFSIPKWLVELYTDPVKLDNNQRLMMTYISHLPLKFEKGIEEE